MKDFRVVFTGRIKRTPTVESFRFEAPEKISFLPGQFMKVVFDEKDRGNRELNKYLSFSCAPDQGYIEATKRISASPFSGQLNSLKTGDELLLEAPLGTCVYKDDYKRIAFLIGGMGITPAISIIEYVVKKDLATDILLVYSNRTDEDIAFRRELDLWRSQRRDLRVYYVVTDCPSRDKTCIYGAIDRDLLKTNVCDIGGRVLYIFGPPRMVAGMETLALELGCGKDDLRVESFVGY